MANPPRFTPGSGTGQDTTPQNFPEVNPRTTQSGHDFTLQAVIMMQRTIATLGTKVDRLLDDRKDDRSEYKQDFREFRAEFKDFRDRDFATVKSDLEKPKLNWAKIVGVATIIAAVVTFIAEIIRSKIAI